MNDLEFRELVKLYFDAKREGSVENEREPEENEINVEGLVAHKMRVGRLALQAATAQRELCRELGIEAEPAVAHLIEAWTTDEEMEAMVREAVRAQLKEENGMSSLIAALAQAVQQGNVHVIDARSRPSPYTGLLDKPDGDEKRTLN